MNFPRVVDNPETLYDEQSEEFETQPLRIRRHTSQNIVSRLTGREMWGGYSKPGTEKYLQRSMYQSIYPNFTVHQVNKPPCFFRKFTPDGKYLIAFSADQMSIEVYYFRGAQAANDLFDQKGAQWVEIMNQPQQLSPPPTAPRAASGSSSISSQHIFSCPAPATPQEHSSEEQTPRYGFFDTHGRPFPDHICSEDRDSASHEVRHRMFDKLFRLKFSIRVAPQGQELNRECSLFTNDYKYIIVGSATQHQDVSRNVVYPHTYSNNESVNPNPRYPLEDYSIHIVDIQHGHLTDSLVFRTDKIFLCHNQGLYLYNRTLAILSIQHQTIHIYNVSGGSFTFVQKIGRFCYEDDALLYSKVPEFKIEHIHPHQEAFMNSLKHRLLTHIFQRIRTEIHEGEEGRRHETKMGIFNQYYEMLRSLRIWKMQLLDEDHLLLKYSSEDVVTLKTTDPNLQLCLFVFYNIPKTEILAVFENSSEALVDIFESFADYFRNNLLTPDGRYCSSPSNNLFCKHISKKLRDTITSDRLGGPTKGKKRILANLPVIAQSFSASPYLDMALYSFDVNRVSAIERPKAAGENPIRFYGRDSRTYKFQLHTGSLCKESSPRGPPLSAFIFHPSAPFAISVHRAAKEYITHFHLRLDPYSVMPL